MKGETHLSVVFWLVLELSRVGFGGVQLRDGWKGLWVDLVKDDLRKERGSDNLWVWKLFCRLDFYSAGHFLGGDSVLRGGNGGGWPVPCLEVLLVFLGLLVGLVREGFWFCLHSVKGCGAQSLCDRGSLGGCGVAVGLRKVE